MPVAASIVLALSGCAHESLEMAGFSAIADRGEVVELGDIGWGAAGRFTLPSIGRTGRFQRKALSEAADGFKWYAGDASFTLEGRGDPMEGQCAYSLETARSDARIGRDVTLSASAVTAPYVYSCGFFRGDRKIGTLLLHQAPGAGLDIRTLRMGEVEVGGRVLGLRSIHTFASSRMPTEMPLGYVMADGGADLGAIYMNGGTRRLVLPTGNEDERVAVLLAGIALALVWDPGDGD